MKKFSVKKNPKRKLTTAKKQSGKQASDIGMNPQAQSPLRRKRMVGGQQKFQHRKPLSYQGAFVTEDEEMYFTSEEEDGPNGFHQPELPRKPQKNYDLDYVMSKRVIAKKRKNQGTSTQGDNVGPRKLKENKNISSFRRVLRGISVELLHKIQWIDKKDQRHSKSAVKDQSAKQQQLKKDVVDSVSASNSSAAGSGDRKTCTLAQKKQHQSKYPQATEKVPMLLYKVNVSSEDRVLPPHLQHPYIYQQNIHSCIVKSLFGKWTDPRWQQNVSDSQLS